MLTIDSDDMESMFAKSICRTYELISQQIQQAKKSKKVNIKVGPLPWTADHFV